MSSEPSDTEWGGLGPAAGSRRVQISQAEFYQTTKQLSRVVDKINELELKISELKGLVDRQREKLSDAETELGKVTLMASTNKDELKTWITRGITVWVMFGILFGAYQVMGAKLLRLLVGA